MVLKYGPEIPVYKKKPQTLVCWCTAQLLSAFLYDCQHRGQFEITITFSLHLFCITSQLPLVDPNSRAFLFFQGETPLFDLIGKICTNKCNVRVSHRSESKYLWLNSLLPPKKKKGDLVNPDYREQTLPCTSVSTCRVLVALGQSCAC